MPNNIGRKLARAWLILLFTAMSILMILLAVMAIIEGGWLAVLTIAGAFVFPLSILIALEVLYP